MTNAPSHRYVVMPTLAARWISHFSDNYAMQIRRAARALPLALVGALHEAEDNTPLDVEQAIARVARTRGVLVADLIGYLVTLSIDQLSLDSDELTNDA